MATRDEHNPMMLLSAHLKQQLTAQTFLQFYPSRSAGGDKVVNGWSQRHPALSPAHSGVTPTTSSSVAS